MAKPEPQPLLSSRHNTALVLDCSIDKVKELERRGILDRVRMTPGGNVYHTYAKVLDCAKGIHGAPPPVSSKRRQVNAEADAND